MLTALLLLTRASAELYGLGDVLAVSPKVEWGDVSLKLKEEAVQDEVLVKLPYYFSDSDVFPHSEKLARLPSNIKLMCRLALERLTATEPSPIRDFVQALPPRYPTYPFWDQISTRLFNEINLGIAVPDDSVIYHVKKALISVPSIDSTKLNHNFMAWVLASFHRYSAKLSPTQSVVSPLQTYIRYSPESNNYLALEGDFLVLKAGDALEAGVNIEWNYGEDLSNPELLLYHGFLRNPNPNNYISLKSSTSNTCFGTITNNVCEIKLKRLAISNELMLTMHFNTIKGQPAPFTDLLEYFTSLPVISTEAESQYSLLVALQKYRRNVKQLQQEKNLRTLRRLLMQKSPSIEAFIIASGVQMMQIKLAQLAEADRMLMRFNCLLLGL